jgi:hypothetical protein
MELCCLGTLGCSQAQAQATSDQRHSDNFRQRFRLDMGTLGGTPMPVGGLAVTLSPSLFQFFLLYLYPVRYPLSTIRYPLPHPSTAVTSFRSQAQRAAAGCRRLQAFAPSPECLPAAGCCSLPLAAATSVTAAANHQNPSVEASSGQFSRSGPPPKETTRTPVSNLHHWAGYPALRPPLFHFHLHHPVSSSFFPSCSLPYTYPPRSIDHHVGNKTLSRCRAVEGRSFLSSHSVRWNFCLVSCRSRSQS